MNAVIPMPADVLEAFEAVEPAKRATLMTAREMIFEVAETCPEVGAVEETLRWGEPAYVTEKRRTGSTIRLAVERGSGAPALFFDCKTTLVEGFRAQFGGALRFVKNRAVLLDDDPAGQAEALAICIRAALRYHLPRAG